MDVSRQTTNKPLPMLDKPYWQEGSDVSVGLSSK